MAIRAPWTIWSSREQDPGAAAMTRTSARHPLSRAAGMIWSHPCMCRPPNRQPPPSRATTWAPGAPVGAVATPMAPKEHATMRTASTDQATTVRPRSSSLLRARPEDQVSVYRRCGGYHFFIGILIDHHKKKKKNNHTTQSDKIQAHTHRLHHRH